MLVGSISPQPSSSKTFASSVPVDCLCLWSSFTDLFERMMLSHRIFSGEMLKESLILTAQYGAFLTGGEALFLPIGRTNWKRMGSPPSGLVISPRLVQMYSIFGTLKCWVARTYSFVACLSALVLLVYPLFHLVWRFFNFVEQLNSNEKSCENRTGRTCFSLNWQEGWQWSTIHER